MSDLCQTLKTPLSLTRYRCAVLARSVLACVGGYALSAVFCAAFGLMAVHAWGMSKVDAVTLATMLSFVVWTVIVISVFATHKASKAWLWWLAATAVCALTTYVLYGGGA